MVKNQTFPFSEYYKIWIDVAVGIISIGVYKNKILQIIHDIGRIWDHIQLNSQTINIRLLHNGRKIMDKDAIKEEYLGLEFVSDLEIRNSILGVRN